MPESMSVERRKLMEIYGAELNSPSRNEGAIERAAELF
jgi:cysteine synthase A